MIEYFSEYIPCLKLVWEGIVADWEPCGHAAFSGIAFHSQQCRKGWADMPSEF